MMFHKHQWMYHSSTVRQTLQGSVQTIHIYICPKCGKTQERIVDAVLMQQENKQLLQHLLEQYKQ